MTSLWKFTFSNITGVAAILIIYELSNTLYKLQFLVMAVTGQNIQ